MKNQLRPALFWALISLLSSCIFTYDPPSEVDYRMLITNASSEDVYYLFSNDDSLEINNAVLLYDLLRKEINGEVIFDTIYQNRIKSNTTDTALQYRNWEEEISYFEDKKLRIYFF